jgi:ribonuclease HI
MKKVTIYTDGACKNNPGRGGVGIILEYEDDKGKVHNREVSKGYRLTTNGRMEIIAALVALQSLKEPCEVRLICDAEYVVKAISEWLPGWKAKGWRRAGNKSVANADLWKLVDVELARHQVTALWVKGHAVDRKNQRCDELASAAAMGGDLEEDTGYKPDEENGSMQGNLFEME